MAEKLIIAATAKEAIKSKSKDNIFMAGGTEVMRLNSFAPGDSFVSVRKVPEMKKIEEKSGSLIIGASCTFQEVLENEKTPAYLKEALGFMASRTRRNMATIGGNIAIKRDDSFLIPTLTAAGAKLNIISDKGSKTIDIADYVFAGPEFEDCLIVSVEVPSKDVIVKSTRSANTAQSHARMTAALGFNGGRYTACVALKNSGIYILKDLANKMSESEMTEDEIIEFVKTKEDIRLEDDLLFGSADYRRYLCGISFALMYADIKG